MYKVNGKNNIIANLITDSITKSGKRMSTFELEYHRFIHSEVMTHKMLEKNSSSSRAIPVSKAITNVEENPSIPVFWGAAQPGMQAAKELDGVDLDIANILWQKGIDQSIELVKEFDKIKLHKQLTCRWLETGQMIKIVISGTDWDNMLWLRNDDAAQPEFHELAKCIQECFDGSTPELLHPGEWHLPYINSYRDEFGELIYVDSTGSTLSLDDARKISASCCAQVSYRKLDDTKEKALEIYDKLFSGTKPHMSPTCHQGTPVDYDTLMTDPENWEIGITHMNRKQEFCSGNLNSWIQYRQILPNNVFVK